MIKPIPSIVSTAGVMMVPFRPVVKSEARAARKRKIAPTTHRPFLNLSNMGIQVINEVFFIAEAFIIIKTFKCAFLF